MVLADPLTDPVRSLPVRRRASRALWSRLGHRQFVEGYGDDADYAPGRGHGYGGWGHGGHFGGHRSH
ncbi:hypothetical protein EBB05_29705 (plasmid) [Methylobacterium brachiatum]|nr:hypothetical protein EBB05_29705 [Methylobacterium brachiatum]